MATLLTVGVASGVPNAGTGTASTLDGLMAAGLNVTATSGTLVVTQATAANLNTTVAGTVTVTQATAANLNVNVTQATAANLNATVAGTVTAVQATAANFNAQVTIVTGGALNVNGQVAMANSAPVAIASNQSFATAAIFPV